MLIFSLIHNCVVTGYKILSIKKCRRPPVEH